MPGRPSAQRPTTRELGARLINVTVARLDHLERLLLGLATLAMVGWGFFYSTSTGHEVELRRAVPGAENVATEAVIGRALFAILFSGLVGSAFNALYTGRMGINLTLLRLEDHLKPEVPPYRGFLVDSGLLASYFVFAVPALFMPLLSIGALVFTVLDLSGRDESAGFWLVVGSAILAAVPVIATTWISLRRVWAVIDHVFKVSPKDPGALPRPPKD